MTHAEANRFYQTGKWKRVRDQVLKLDHYECQMCKARGKYTRADVVHHVHHLRDRPELALSVWHEGERQLVSLCNACHNEVHPEKRAGGQAKKPPLTEEWW